MSIPHDYSDYNQFRYAALRTIERGKWVDSLINYGIAPCYLNWVSALNCFCWKQTGMMSKLTSC
jgi:hypothetical protein